MGCENLGARVHALVHETLPDTVRAAAESALLNVSGAAIAACRHDVVEMMLSLARKHGGKPVAPIVGRSERSDIYFSALIAGTAARLLAFDDTYLATLLSPSAAPFGALLALAGTREVGGALALTAFVLGSEVAIRLAKAISPHHYEVGWDASGTCGVIGAAVTGAIVLGSDPVELQNAIGIAASQIVGQRVALGTPSGTLHAGKGSSNGVIAALLASQGFTGPSRLDEPFGFFHSFPVDEPSLIDAVVDDLGERWDILDNTIKPYPCETLSHPAIDAALSMRASVADPQRIVEIRVRSHPQVVELAGLADPHDGLEAVLSTAHGVAVALLDGVVGLDQYAPARITSADVRSLRKLVRLLPDSTCGLDSASVEIEFDQGNVERYHVTHGRGSISHRMTEGDIFAKVRALLDRSVPGSGERLYRAVGGLHEAKSASPFIDSLTPESVPA